jgi:uncharacterized protein with ParB-like and HNH nuclease domain
MKMRFEERTIKTLFETSRFAIPAYQRAYSWDEEQCEAFYYDLEEQTKSANDYFLGNIIVENNDTELYMEIIDGQQRLATVIIFLRVAYDKIKDNNNVKNFNKVFFEDDEGVKFKSTNIDETFFYDNIIKGKNEKQKIQSPSQKRIINAKKYFTRALKNKNYDEIRSILEKLTKATVTVTILDQKLESAFMFELQNNRGKPLTNMEKLKAYLMYQLYLNGYNEHEVNIQIVDISKLYEQIYTLINELSNIDEDDILLYHLQAYYGYKVCDRGSTVETVRKLYKERNEIESIQWIKEFLFQLNETFANIKSLQKNTNIYFQRLKLLGMPAFIYPFLIKGLKTISENNNLSKLFHILEMAAFRKSIIKSKAKIAEHLNDSLLGFSGDVEELYKNIAQILQEKWYWGDENLDYQLDSGELYNNASEKGLIYLLAMYESYISNEKNLIKINNLSIEHIAPQTPKNTSGTGYELLSDFEGYKKKFKVDYLNCLGNLALITSSLNSKVSNEIFSQKIKLYKEAYKENKKFMQLNEIERFVDKNNVKWGFDEVQKRHNKIKEYVWKEWSFEKNKKI